MESKGEIVIYKTEDGKSKLEVHLENETIWLSQKLMSELFDKDSNAIRLHIKNIFGDEELEEETTTELFSAVQKDRNRTVTSG